MVSTWRYLDLQGCLLRSDNFIQRSPPPGHTMLFLGGVSHTAVLTDPRNIMISYM